MSPNRPSILVILGLFLSLGSFAHAVPEPEEFVVNLYHRFAYREPTSSEVTYWSEKILTMTPEKAEGHLRNWFFVHAAYKTTLDRTVTMSEVESLVKMLDAGEINYQAVQWSLFTSPEYKKVKAEGRAGKNMMKFTPNPL